MKVWRQPCLTYDVFYLSSSRLQSELIILRYLDGLGTYNPAVWLVKLQSYQGKMKNCALPVLLAFHFILAITTSVCYAEAMPETFGSQY